MIAIAKPDYYLEENIPSSFNVINENMVNSYMNNSLKASSDIDSVLLSIYGGDVSLNNGIGGIKDILTGHPVGRNSLATQSEIVTRSGLASINFRVSMDSIRDAANFISDMRVEFLPEPTACEECTPLAGIYDIDAVPNIPVHLNLIVTGKHEN